MFSSPLARWLAALPALAALSLSARGAAPAVATLPVPGLAFESALQGYPFFVDQAVMSWRDANDTVGRIGGWRSYAREAAQAEAARPSGPATSQGAHGGHGTHHGQPGHPGHQGHHGGQP